MQLVGSFTKQEFENWFNAESKWRCDFAEAFGIERERTATPGTRTKKFQLTKASLRRWSVTSRPLIVADDLIIMNYTDDIARGALDNFVFSFPGEPLLFSCLNATMPSSGSLHVWYIGDDESYCQFLRHDLRLLQCKNESKQLEHAFDEFETLNLSPLVLSYADMRALPWRFMLGAIQSRIVELKPEDIDDTDYITVCNYEVRREDFDALRNKHIRYVNSIHDLDPYITLVTN